MQTYSVEARLRATGVKDFTNSFKDATKHVSNFEKIGGKLQGIGKKMTKSVTLPLVAMGAAIMTTGAKFSDQMSTVQAVTGATGDEMDKMRELAKQMGRDTRFSASEAGEGMEMLARAGFETDEIMSALPSVLDLAAAGAVDLGDAADITSNILSGYGMEADETARITDVLARASADSNVDVEGLGEAFKYVGPIASDMGISIEDTAAAIGFLGDAGIQGGQAGRQLRKGLQSLAAPTSEASGLMNELGIEIFDSNGEMKDMPGILSELESGLDGMGTEQKAAALETLFGADAMSAWSVLVNEGADELGDFSEVLADSEGAAGEMADVMEDNLAGSFRELKSALEGIAIEFSELGEGPLRTLVDKLTELARSFSGLSDSTQQWIVIAAGVAAIAGPIIWVVGKIIALIPTLMTIIGALVTAVKFIAGVVAAVAGAISTPIWIAIGVIAAAAALIYVFWEPIRDFFIMLWEGIKIAGIAVWEFLKEVWSVTAEFFVTLWEGAIELFTTIWNNVKTFFVELWESITETAVNVWDIISEAWSRAVEIVYELFSPLIEFFMETWENITENASDAWENFTDMISTVWDGIKTIASNVWEMIKIAIITPILVLIQMLTGDFEGARDTLSQIWDRIKEIAKSTWDSLKSIVSALIKGLIDYVKKSWNNAKEFLSGLWSAIKDTASNLWEGMKSALSRIVSATKTAVQNKWNEIKSAVVNKAKEIVTAAKDKFEEVKNGIKDKLTEAVTVVGEKIAEMPGKIMEFFGDMLDAGKMLIAGLINGIKQMGKDAIEAITGVVGGVIDKAKGLLKIESPSKVFDQFGVFLGEGFVDGIDSMKRKVEGASERMAQASMIDVEPINIGSRVNSINRQAERQLNHTFDSNINVNNKQPAYINVSIGNRDFEGFVDDISEVQDRNTMLQKAFS